MVIAWRDDWGMAATAAEVSTTGLVDAKRSSDRRKRRQWPEALKRGIVAETLEPGSSVSIVARRHDVNANQLFKWRREMAPEQKPAADDGVPLLPVEIVPEQAGYAVASVRMIRQRVPLQAGHMALAIFANEVKGRSSGALPRSRDVGTGRPSCWRTDQGKRRRRGFAIPRCVSVGQTQLTPTRQRDFLPVG